MRQKQKRHNHEQKNGAKRQARNRLRYFSGLAAFFLLFVPLSFQAAFAEDDLEALSIYYRKDELVVTPTRTPKPLSQTAENMTIITAKEIEEMNAHSVAEVLNYVTGVNIDHIYHNSSAPLIQGSTQFEVKVMIDDVVLNDLSTDMAPIDFIPVQNIERIEIIKGPASSAWGSSLGGVINIITKSGESPKPGGLFSASYGKRSTGDYRAEISGREPAFGYYFDGGEFRSGGFFPGQEFERSNLYAKVGYDVTESLDLLFTLGYSGDERGLGEDRMSDLIKHFSEEELFLTVQANYRLAGSSELSFSARTKTVKEQSARHRLSTGEYLASSSERDLVSSGALKFSIKQGPHALSLGADFEQDEFEYGNEQFPGVTNEIHITRSKWAVFGNDTITLGNFAVTPGMRYDSIQDNEDFLSPSLGITYNLREDTILRAYTAKGFNSPGFGLKYYSYMNAKANPDLRNEKIWSIQAGIETTAIKYLWLKAGLFRHSISDAFYGYFFPDGSFTVINKSRQVVKGIEFEAGTAPVYNTSISAGVSIIDARDAHTDEKIPLRPANTYNVGIRYRDRSSFTAVLKGHYVNWNSPPSYFPNASENRFLWDLNLSKTIYKSDTGNAEVFFTAHNIFNGKQYGYDISDESYRFPERWLEAGLRAKF